MGVILEISEDGHSTSVGRVELQNFSSKAQCKFIHKNVCALQNLTLVVTQYHTILNKLKGTVDNFLQLSVPQISPFYQQYLFSTGDSIIMLKLELYVFDLNLFSV